MGELAPQNGTMIGVIGAGTMGSGIAIAVANSGRRALVVDTDSAALERSHTFIGDNYDALQRKGRLDAAEVRVRLGAIAHTTDFLRVGPCPIVIEAVFESLALKVEVFSRLAAVCAADAILATNTSTLDVDAIAAASGSPQRCIGMHFFSPAHIMKLIEVVRGRKSSQATIDAICELARQIGKTPVVVANADGFVGNRMLLDYRREAEFLVLAGARPREVDAALEAFGFAMGPFAVADLAGIDIGVRSKVERAARGQAPPFGLSDISDGLVAAGRLGRKSGRGYYSYAAPEPASDPLLDTILNRERTRLGVVMRPVDAQEIVERCVFALVQEGNRLLATQIAASADDIDTIWRLGYGFPAARGGPMAYARSLGRSHVEARIAEFARTDPAFWGRGPKPESTIAAGKNPYN